ncbi:UDP-N-acetylmuramoyl-L-alanine--D-glutamate ligase [Candidatus Parcubacteria bacterium]|nr:UDP-N-acetylmuramoyl-L-alanine--D-glutamate ligase [Candidatus Parcubacteria bacterium]
MGLGLHGGAVAVVKWLLKNKSKLTITDVKTKQELKNSLDKIKTKQKIKYTLGGHDIKDFVDQDLIVQNPGVPADSKYLIKARQNKIPIVNEAVMFFGLYPGKSIGITGTRGKSTTATILHHILKTKIKSNVVAGNIATNPMFTVLDKIKKNTWPVLELSSWHLENMAEYKKSPHIAVVTNVLVDHLNRYKNFAAYKKAKLAIVKNQNKDDIAVLNADNVHSYGFAKQTKAKKFFFSLHKKVRGAYLCKDWICFYDGQKKSRIMPIQEIKLLGEHNLANILAAVTVAKIIGVGNKNIRLAVSKFKGVDYRLQYKGRVKGIDIFNDSTSTTPDATQAALRAMQCRQVVLIAGGEDKQLDYRGLAKTIKEIANFVILLSGTGSEKLIKELTKIDYPAYKLVTDINKLKNAWRLSLKHVNKQAGCILFSPAAASFNMFDNEFDRAKQFDKLFDGEKKTKK